jgi:hypothetical protein
LDDVVNAYGDDYQASEYGAQIHYEYTFKTDDGKQGILRFAVSKNSQTVEYISVRLADEKTDGAKQAFLAYHKAISKSRPARCLPDADWGIPEFCRRL